MGAHETKLSNPLLVRYITERCNSLHRQPLSHASQLAALAVAPSHVTLALTPDSPLSVTSVFLAAVTKALLYLNRTQVQSDCGPTYSVWGKELLQEEHC